jgi:hypothetical protein
MAMPEVQSPSAGAELAGVVRKILDGAEEPLNVKQLLKQLKGPFRCQEEELQRILEQQIEQGGVFRFPKYRRYERFWTRDLETYGRQTILEVLSARSLTRSELKPKLATRLQGISESRRNGLLGELLQRGDVRELPAFVGTTAKRLSAAAADPRDYLEHALGKICEKLAKDGISQEQVFAAARKLIGIATNSAPSTAAVADESPSPIPSAVDSPIRPELQEVVLDRMLELEPAARLGAMIYVPDLWRGAAIQQAEKSDVQRAVWELVRQERIVLHRHGHPASLNQEQRGLLFTDADGAYYHGISMRTP